MVAIYFGEGSKPIGFSLSATKDKTLAPLIQKKTGIQFIPIPDGFGHMKPCAECGPDLMGLNQPGNRTTVVTFVLNGDGKLDPRFEPFVAERSPVATSVHDGRCAEARVVNRCDECQKRLGAFNRYQQSGISAVFPFAIEPLVNEAKRSAGWKMDEVDYGLTSLEALLGTLLALPLRLRPGRFQKQGLFHDFFSIVFPNAGMTLRRANSRFLSASIASIDRTLSS